MHARTMDRDGLVNTDDNCPFIENPEQEDADGDGFGDVCDNCLDVASETQPDIDYDSIGDACRRRVDSARTDREAPRARRGREHL